MSVATFCSNILTGWKPERDFWKHFTNDQIDEIYNFLVERPDNANCLFYLAKFYESFMWNHNYPKYLVSYQKISELYQQAAALGHLDAKYHLASTDYDPEALIDLLRNGYAFPINHEDKIDDIELYEALTRDLLVKHDDLARRVLELEQKILELEHRPPSVGGPQYEAAKTHFETLL